MNRFFNAVDVAQSANGFEVRLDGRVVRTPAKHALALPKAALADAIAAEWAAQGGQVRPETMPLTRLAHVAIDRTPDVRAGLVAEIVKYAETDLLCHRAQAPPALVARQAAAWDPILAWAADFGVALEAGAGVLALAQPPTALQRMADLAAAADDWRLTGLGHGVGLMGSAVLALALAEGEICAETACACACLDELWSLETWGEDGELRARVEAIGADVAALERWFRALGG